MAHDLKSGDRVEFDSEDVSDAGRSGRRHSGRRQGVVVSVHEDYATVRLSTGILEDVYYEERGLEPVKKSGRRNPRYSDPSSAYWDLVDDRSHGDDWIAAAAVDVWREMFPDVRPGGKVRFATHSDATSYFRKVVARAKRDEEESMRKNPSPFDSARPGDVVTYTTRHGGTGRGKVVFALQPSHLTLNTGGRHGTAVVVMRDQVVSVRRTKSQHGGGHFRGNPTLVLLHNPTRRLLRKGEWKRFVLSNGEHRWEREWWPTTGFLGPQYWAKVVGHNSRWLWTLELAHGGPRRVSMLEGPHIASRLSDAMAAAERAVVAHKNRTADHRLNPSSPPKAWEKFHQRSGTAAEATEIPDIPGVPGEVVALGFFHSLITARGQVVRVKHTQQNGPWLATNAAMTRLFVVGRYIDDLRPLYQWCDVVRGKEGARFSGVGYYPNRTSGKFVQGSHFVHLWGDGGRLPKSRWSEVWPYLHAIKEGHLPARVVAYEFKGGKFRVEGRGIVN